jgi:type 1 glutamine amidotransferase
MKFATTILAALVLLANHVQAERLAKPGKIRVSLTVGGHGFDEKPFYAMFDAMPKVEYVKARLPRDAKMLKPGLEKRFDVLVRYDMVAGFSPKQEKAFVALLQAGIGLVSLHHNEAAHENTWPQYAKIIARTPNKTWSEAEEMRITVVDKTHPITHGVSDFTIRDETYGGYRVSPQAHVLLKTDHPKNGREIAWVTKYGNSRVVYRQLGHDRDAYANPQFRALLTNAIRLVAVRSRPAETKKVPQ